SELGLERGVDVDPVGLRGGAEQLLVEAEDAPELLDRPLVVVNAEVDERVGEAGVAAVLLHDEQARGLLPALVAACGLGGVEAVEEAGRKGLAGGALERHGERIDRLLRDEDVALGRIAVAGSAARPLEALLAGERRGASLAVDDS